MAGRKPVGPALADRVEASEEARTRLKVLLETITGEKSMEAACQALGIRKTHLFTLRTRVLKAAAAALEPGPVGRPPQAARPEAAGPQAARIAELEAQVQQLHVELEASRVRLELAEAMPGRTDENSPGRKKKAPRRRRV